MGVVRAAPACVRGIAIARRCAVRALALTAAGASFCIARSVSIAQLGRGGSGMSSRVRRSRGVTFADGGGCIFIVEDETAAVVVASPDDSRLDLPMSDSARLVLLSVL